MYNVKVIYVRKGYICSIPVSASLLFQRDVASSVDNFENGDIFGSSFCRYTQESSGLCKCYCLHLPLSGPGMGGGGLTLPESVLEDNYNYAHKN